MTALAARLFQTDHHYNASPRQAFGKVLLTIYGAARGLKQALEARRELAGLDLRLLDDVGLTVADRDALLHR
ncbi:MAG: DUF1127 domain-containing protein [Methylobacteriaceae bacterium]|nr:DUF1127 domain-containing protein [Methylobacteriaceae bacterium]